jgi:hypothetical protein
MVKAVIARTPRKAAGNQRLVRVTAAAKVAVKVAAMHVHAATMRRLAIVVQPPTAPLPHAAKTAAILAHLPAITAPKRVVMATIRAR